jgi:hypothetical protein
MNRCLTLVRYWGLSRPNPDISRSPLLTHSGRSMFGRIFGLDGRESYRELRLESLCCKPRNCSHEREYPRRKDRF